MENNKNKTGSYKDLTESHHFEYEELAGHYEVLWHWISSNDKWYELYTELRDSQELAKKHGYTLKDDDSDVKFLKLFKQNLNKELNVWDDGLSPADRFEKGYQEDNARHEQWRNNGGMSQKEVDMQSFINRTKAKFEHRDDADAQVIQQLLRLLAITNTVKYPESDSDEVDFILNMISREDVL